jgi:hypothetical protein
MHPIAKTPCVLLADIVMQQYSAKSRKPSQNYLFRCFFSLSAKSKARNNPNTTTRVVGALAYSFHLTWLLLPWQYVF